MDARSEMHSPDHAGHADGSAAVDLEFLRQLAEAVGGEELNVLAASMKADAAGQLAVLSGSLSADDTETLRRAAHRLAGLFSQFGAAGVAETVEALRSTCDAAEARRLGNVLHAYCNCALLAIDAAVGEIAAAPATRAA